MDRLRTLSLFSGGGGLDAGLARWCRPVAYCEFDPYAQGVLLSRMARGDMERAPVWDDVRTLRAEHFGAEPVDAICGGFPCQDLSLAGAGRGLDGERSGLFWEIVRLARELEPGWLFLENVSALATRGLDRVLLALHALGFDARWGVVAAAEVGAPHLRRRLFIVAAHPERCGIRLEQQWASEGREAGALRDPRQALALQHGAEGTLADDHGEGQLLRAAGWSGERHRPGHGGEGGGGRAVGVAKRPDCAGLEERQGEPRDARAQLPATLGADWWAAEPSVGRVAHGVAHRKHRIRVLGNGCVPAQVAEAVRRLVGLPNGS